jgi:predicted nucleotidyltransferase component of viral defense system
MDYFQAQRLASQQKVPVEIIEKDFLIEILLFYLGKESFFKERFIFRGGTAIKKVYFTDYRFSEDIDFLLMEDQRFEICTKKYSEITEKINDDHPYGLNISLGESSQERLQLFIFYDIIPEIRSTKSLKVDISKDDVIPSYHRRKILFSYQQFKSGNVEVYAYDLESIASDKICRILDVDNEPRDLYDLWYLLKLRINAAKIKREFRKRIGFDFRVPSLLREIKREEFKRNWEKRLRNQIANLPSYENVIKELERLIAEKFIRR